MVFVLGLAKEYMWGIKNYFYNKTSKILTGDAGAIICEDYENKNHYTPF